MRVSPMRADGSLTQPAGAAALPGWGRIASNGSSFMLAHLDDKAKSHAVLLDDSGAPVGTDTPLGSYPQQLDIVSNGHSYLVIDSGDAIVFMPDGTPFAKKTFPGLPLATAIGDVYVLLYFVGPAPELHLVLMSEDAATTDRIIGAGSEVANRDLTVGAAPDRLLLALIGANDIRTMIVGRDGSVISPLKTTTGSFGRAVARLFWDGASFLVSWQANGSLQAIRVSANNDVLDTTPAIIGRGSADLSLTRTSDTIAALWSSNGDVWERTFASNAALMAEPPASAPAVIGLHAQSAAALAVFGSEPLRVWNEGTLDQQVMLSIGDKTVEVTSVTDRQLRDASVARGGNIILVAWIAQSDLYARRFALDGTPLDAQPVLVSPTIPVYHGAGTATAFDGRNFIVLWPQDAPRAARITPSGTLLDTTPFAITGPTQFDYTTGMHAVWTGSELLVSWATFTKPNGVDLPVPPAHTAVQIARLDTRSMSIIDARALPEERGESFTTDLAWDGRNALLVSLFGGCVQATLLDAKLKTLANDPAVECGANAYYWELTHPSAAWNDSEYVVTWTAFGDVHAIRFDASLARLDDAPFTVASSAFDPSIAASAAGTEITYRQYAENVPRLFARTLDRIGLVRRTRPVTH